MNMMISDPISDMFTRIRNARLVGHKIVPVISTKLTCGIVKVLLKNGFIDSVKGTFQRITPNAPIKFDQFLLISLKYTGISNYRLLKRNYIIKKIQRVSKPGARRYIWSSCSCMIQLMSTFNDSILIGLISSNRGILTFEEARKLKIGGEVIGFIKNYAVM